VAHRNPPFRISATRCSIRPVDATNSWKPKLSIRQRFAKCTLTNFGLNIQSDKTLAYNFEFERKKIRFRVRDRHNCK
jgi:hypothetical protein